MEHWTEIGVGGLLAIGVLRTVFDYLKTRNGAAPITKVEFADYWAEFRSHVETDEVAMKEMANALTAQTEVLRIAVRDNHDVQAQHQADMRNICQHLTVSTETLRSINEKLSS